VLNRASAMQRSRRAPDNELFDRGCDLVEAASAIRRLAADAETARAIPALLGCIETSLQELAAAASELEGAEPPVITSERSLHIARARRRRGVANLRVALADAAAASHAARALTARVLQRVHAE
jgi:hypothetical protein